MWTILTPTTEALEDEMSVDESIAAGKYEVVEKFKTLEETMEAVEDRYFDDSKYRFRPF